MKRIAIFTIVFFYVTSYAQNYSKEVVNLWDQKKPPFNKENIEFKETVDSTGRRFSKISDPVLYIYRKDSQESKGPTILYYPGGGYAIVSIKDEGESRAKRFLEMGFNIVAILKYRLPDSCIVYEQEKVPLADAQKALSLLHQNAEKWGIDENKIAVMGGSAGGHLASSLANLKDSIVAPGVKPENLSHAVSILMYPVISFNLPYRHKGSYKRLLGQKSENQSFLDYYSMENQVSENTPPTFLVHARDDSSVSYQNSIIYRDSLKKYNVPFKYIELEKGGHGFGFNFEKTGGVDWTIELEDWLYKNTSLFENAHSTKENRKFE
ncbi:alpha/beta hydrolase [Christiangramia crocea]|uniref:Alpha/beta hydrolase n=1 Tax=Christiangramia crocea TaxID=2904124 RepID=A0A9X2A570_9FLAO|nr:alpha/beta hydrolase [Gramella crocea]MCG9971174.1 alpha/beta hydrolase [Gramella crocea]